MKPKILAYIPARSGSTRIKNKNIKNFLGKPLIAYTIEQALSCKFVDRVIVDTDSKKIADVAKKYGAEAPFLRTKKFATSKSQIIDTVINLIKKLDKKENYKPDLVLLLQATSPLREKQDIIDCVNLISRGKTDSVITVAPTHFHLYHFDSQRYIFFSNKELKKSTNIQDWKEFYIPNGSIYLTKIKTLLNEKKFFPKKTKGVVLPKWRSVDIDTPEEWIMAELMYKNKCLISRKLKNL